MEKNHVLRQIAPKGYFTLLLQNRNQATPSGPRTPKGGQSPHSAFGHNRNKSHNNPTSTPKVTEKTDKAADKIEFTTLRPTTPTLGKERPSASPIALTPKVRPVHKQRQKTACAEEIFRQQRPKLEQLLPPPPARYFTTNENGFMGTAATTFQQTFRERQHSLSFTKAFEYRDHSQTRRYSFLPAPEKKEIKCPKQKSVTRLKDVLEQTGKGWIRDTKKGKSHVGKVTENIVTLKTKISHEGKENKQPSNSIAPINIDTSIYSLSKTNTVAQSTFKGKESFCTKERIFGMKVEGQLFDTLYSIHT